MDLYKPYIRRNKSFVNNRESLSSERHLQPRNTERNMSGNKHEAFIYKMMT
jgi:hypothetical protein